MDLLFNILQVIIGSGLIAAIYGNYTQVKFQNRLKLHEICEVKFRSILIFMDIVLYPNRIIHTSEINNPMIQNIDLKNHEEVRTFYKNIIQANIANIYLYSDTKLIDSLNEFIQNPTQETYIKTAKLMNKILWK